MKKTTFEKATETVLGSKLESKDAAIAKPAWAALTLAGEMDRLTRKLVDGAEFMARKSTEFSSGLALRGRANGLSNPASYVSTLVEMAKDDAALEAREYDFRTIVTALYGTETVKEIYETRMAAIESNFVEKYATKVFSFGGQACVVVDFPRGDVVAIYDLDGGEFANVPVSVIENAVKFRDAEEADFEFSAILSSRFADSAAKIASLVAEVAS